MSLSNLPLGERPRERLLRMGPGSLSLQELLAVLLRTGQKGTDVMALAACLLKEYPDERALGRTTATELCGFSGLGSAKAATLLAAIELGRRSWCDGKENGGAFWQSTLKNLEKSMIREEREFILALFTDREGRLLGSEKVSFRGAWMGLSSMLHTCAAGPFALGRRESCSSIIILTGTRSRAMKIAP